MKAIPAALETLPARLNVVAPMVIGFKGFAFVGTTHILNSNIDDNKFIGTFKVYFQSSHKS